MKRKSTLLRFLFLGATFAMLILIFTLQIRIKTLEKEKAEWEQQIEDYRLIVEEMDYNLDLPMEEYIEKYAREVLGYHKYSDIIIKEPEDE